MYSFFKEVHCTSLIPRPIQRLGDEKREHGQYRGERLGDKKREHGRYRGALY